MKKISKIFLLFSIFLCTLFVFSACEVGEFDSLDVSYAGKQATFDEFSSSVFVEYGTVLNLQKSDFVVYRVNKKGKKQKTQNYELDASSVNNRRLVIGDYVIYFSNEKEDYKTQLIVHVYEKEVEKPTFASFETEFDQNRVNIKEYLESQPGFDPASMIVEESSSSVTEATNAGTYKTKINLRYGHVWNTQSGKTDSIEFVWKINKKAIAIPKVVGEKTFFVEYDSEYNLVSHTLVLEKNYQSAFYLTTNNTQSNAGKHMAVLTIINDNYAFVGNKSVAEIEFEILPKTLKAVSLVGNGEYEYSGQEIVPTLENYIPAFMQVLSETNRVSAGNHVANVCFKKEHETNFVFEGENQKNISIPFEILKKVVATPHLKNDTFTYSGTAPVLEVEDFDENLFTLGDYSRNINVGFYFVYVFPKNDDVAENYAYEGSNSMSIIPLEYEIVRATAHANIIFSVPDGETLKDGLVASGSVSCEDIDVSSSYEVFLVDGENLTKVSEISQAGNYVLRLIVDFDRRNYSLFDAETGEEIDNLYIEKTFTIVE